jgi:hypothetical protein
MYTRISCPFFTLSSEDMFCGTISLGWIGDLDRATKLWLPF